MIIVKKFLSFCFRPIKLFKSILTILKFGNSDSLRVLIYHDIPPNQTNKFREQLEWLKKSYTFICPQTFELMIMGIIPVKGNNLLLTFDDGFSSNKVIAEIILDELEIKAIFFVISDFIDIQNPEESKEFISKKILLDTITEEVPNHMSNMSWNDLIDLHKSGHTIGAHTSSHNNLSNIKTKEELYKEIVISANKIENYIGCKVNHFAYPFGNLSSFTKDAFNLADDRFKFIHSGIRGCNLRYNTKNIILRDSLQTYYSNNEIGILIEGLFDFYYSSSRKTLNKWSRLGKTKNPD